jgi:NADH-quinone oxidoreductase subunit M
MLGLFALNPLGVQGSVLQMVNHGISTGGLFALVGMLYERYHTRQIADLSGLARRTPWLAFFLVLFTFSSIGVPGLNGFAGEFLILLGMFQRAWAEAPAAWATQFLVISVLAVSGVVLGAWYMLWLVQRVMFGPLKEPKTEHPVSDLSFREILALAPLAVFIVWIGLRPGDFLSRTGPTLEAARQPAAVALEKLEQPTETARAR